ncbi:Glucose N-acetyltransferase-like protein 1 [Elsinoe fawcettii]|nr:Glucose N-acetyltransferase-like protein 1 [Elsinoe fawcettii]
MMFEALHRLNSSASRLLLYNDEWAPKPPPVPHRSWLARFLFKPMPLTPAMLQRDSYIHKLLVLAQEQYNVILKPVPVLRRSGEWTWAESFTKLLAFNQTQYKRVLSLDSDATLLAHMDDLFLRPSTAIAAPRAYWLEDQKVLSSQVMLIEPSQDKWDKIMARIEKREQEEFDMEVLNAVFGKEATVLEHRGYDLLSGEFRKTNHTAYLAGVSGEDKGEWNATRVLEQAKYVHFSDWPLKKPWFYRGEVREKFREHQPTCEIRAGGETLCSDRDAWLWLYNDFLERRERT